MRYRLMASYLGASYQAAVGPSDRDVTLFAAPPPPEEHGFSPAQGGVWRKQVRLNDIDALWESRPVGDYHGEPCLVLDDQGDRLHIVYLGMDERRADQLGYWQVDRGVFEVVVPRQEVTDLAEERHEFAIALLLSALPWGGVPGPHHQPPMGGQLPPAGAQQPLTGSRQLPAVAPQATVGPPAGPVQAGGAPYAAAAPPAGGPQQMPGAQQLPVRQQPPNPQPPAAAAAWHGSPATDSNGTWYYQGGGTAQNGTPPQSGAAAVGPTGLPAGYGDGPQDSYRQFASGPPQAPPNGVASSAAHYSPPAPQQPGQDFLPARQPQPAQPQASQPQPGLPQAVQPPRLSQQPHSAPLPQSAQLAQPMPLALPVQPSQPFQTAPPGQPAPQAPLPAPQVQAAPQVQPGAAALAPQVSAMAPPQAAPAPGALVETAPTDPLISLPSMPQPGQVSHPSQQAQAALAPPPATQPSALSKLTGAVRGRRAARKPRLAMSAVFADLVDMAAIPRSAYAVDEEVTGAMCLFKTDGGYEVFSCAEDARHEVRFFEEEEAAYFYLFGVLAAEALRNGRLTPRRG
jgi:hypothetical protein